MADGVPEAFEGAFRCLTEGGFQFGESVLDCVSILALYAGFLVRDDCGSAARIWSSSPPVMVTSQMCWPPR
jgi:hypothetical protein